jgi:hypothetical protein
MSRSLPQVFTDFTGILSPAGRATATLKVPSIEALRGLRVFFAFVILHPGGGLKNVSNLLGVTIGAGV